MELLHKIYATELQYCLDEYLINIDREPLLVQLHGINCPNAVIISEMEFLRLQQSDASLQTMGKIIQKYRRLLMLNKVHLIGHLGKDPEIKNNKEGDEFLATFSLATSETYKDNKTGELVTKPEWHNVVCFNKHIFDTLKKYAPKGRQVYVEGKIKTTSYTKAGEESARYATQIVAENIKLLGEKKEAEI